MQRKSLNKEWIQASLVALVKNPPANTGDTGSIPIWEDPTCHKQLSLCAMTSEPMLWELQLLSPRALSPCSTTREATTMRKPIHCS